jgi:hypothetical protein
MHLNREDVNNLDYVKIDPEVSLLPNSVSIVTISLEPSTFTEYYEVILPILCTVHKLYLPRKKLLITSIVTVLEPSPEKK